MWRKAALDSIRFDSIEYPANVQGSTFPEMNEGEHRNLWSLGPPSR